MLYAISAPSGTGKTTVVKEMLKIFPGLRLSVSATTRNKRNCESNGCDYFFISKEEFLDKVNKNEFVEYENVYADDYYGTLKEQVDNYIKDSHDVIFDIDVKGALSIRNHYKNLAKLIYLQPPDKNVVIERLKKRATETPEQIETRIKRYEWEMSKINEFDYIVINDNLNSAFTEVENIIKQFKI